MEQTEKKALIDCISGFITSYRKVIIGLLVFVFTAAVAVGITLSVTEAKKESGLAALDTLELEYNKLQEAEQTDEQKKSEVLGSVRALAEKSSGIVRTRSAMFAADVDFKDKNWEDSRTYWLMAAKTQKKSYTAPICYYNAAVCSEQLSDLPAALLYFDTASQNEDFPLAARALFSAGRIEEIRGNYAQAAECYEKLNRVYNGTDWANLGKSRVIYLRSSGKIQ